MAEEKSEINKAHAAFLPIDAIPLNAEVSDIAVGNTVSTNDTKGQDSLTHFATYLPQDLIKYIALYLDYKTLLCISGANDQLKTILEDNLLWKIKFIQYFTCNNREFKDTESNKESWRSTFLDNCERLGYEGDDDSFDSTAVAIFRDSLENDDPNGLQKHLNNQSTPLLFDLLVNLQSKNQESYWRTSASPRMLSYFYDMARDFFESEQCHSYFVGTLYNSSSDPHFYRGYVQTQLYWALVLDAPLTEIKRLVRLNPKCLEERYRMVYSNDYLNPIHLAAREGRLEIVQFFLECDRSLLNVRSCKGRTTPTGNNLLYWAAIKNQTDVVSYCLAQPELQCAHEALKAATSYQAKETLILLLDADVDIKNQSIATNDWQQPALYSLELTTIILEKRPHLINAKVFLVTQFSMSLLYCAAWQSSLDVLRYLLSRPEVDPNLGSDNTYSPTPLHAASRENNAVATAKVQALLEAKADPMIPAAGPLSIHLAIRNRNMEMIQLLLAANPALLNAPDQFGRTPLFLVLEQDNHPMVTKKDLATYLLDQPDIDLKVTLRADYIALNKHEHVTVFHLAIISGQLDIMKTLLQREPGFLNYPTGDGSTPLLLACAESGSEMVDYLLQQKPELNAANAAGQTALQVAMNYRNTVVMNMLVMATPFTAQAFKEGNWPSFLTDCLMVTHESPLQLALQENKREQEQVLQVLNKHSAIEASLQLQPDGPMHPEPASLVDANLSQNGAAFQSVYNQRISFFNPVTTSSRSSTLRLRLLSGISCMLGAIALFLAFFALNVATLGTASGVVLAAIGTAALLAGGLGLLALRNKNPEQPLLPLASMTLV